MIPILYESNETEFTSNGIGRLPDMISAKPKQTRNGIFEVEFEYPITGRHYDDILEGRIIAMLHDETGDIQPFDIYGRTAPLDGVATFYARHISYRLGGITVQPFTASSCAQALQFLKTNSITNNPFTFWTDKAVSGDFNVEVPSNLKSLLGGTKGSILDVFGTGEYEFDKWDVKLHLHRGSDTGVEIRYGKNLADLQDKIDYSDCYTGVVPFWQGKDGDTETVVTIDGYVINSGNTSYGNRQIIVPLDLSSEFQEKPTKAQLKATAQTWLANSEAWLPSRTIKVDFVQLWQTEEYKNYAPLQRVGLCDTVTVYYPRMNINVKMKVIEVTYDALAERYTEMVLGSTASTYADLIKAESAKQIAEAHNRIMRIIGNSNFATQTELQEAVQNATDLITGGLGGYVVFGFNANGKPEELLILDNEDITQAVNVWRWNRNGLGFSSNGYSGPFGTAITSDGKIVADYVLTGSLTANLIKTGILMDAAGTNYWNMQTGEFRLAAQTQVGSSGQTLNDLASKAGTIANVDVEYALGTSASTAPSSGWSTNTPTWESGKYVWTRTKTTNGVGNVSYSNPTCIQGAKGEAGTSVTILGSYNTYAELVAAHPTGSAGDAYLVNGDLYVWSTNASAWSNVGNIQGPQGAAGTNGVGISSTTITYGVSASGSTEPTSWQSTIPTVSEGQWLWVRTVYTYTDSSTYTFKTKSYIGTDGADGKSVYVRSATKSGGVTTVVLTDGTNTNTLTIVDGEDGDNGQPGANGYVHVAWATSADGSEGFSTSASAGKTYLGTYTDNTQADSQRYQDYSWSLIKGADGQDGADGNGIRSVTVTYGLSQTVSTRPTTWQTTIPSASQGEYIWTRTVTDYTDDSVADTVTYTYSRQGVDGESGEDGTSVQVTSITYQKGDSATTPPTGTWSTTIPQVETGKNLWTKTVFSDGTIAYGVAHQGRDGTDGTDGTDGVGIATIKEQYYLSTSKTAQAGGSWSDTQPTWVSGKYIWTRSEITWTDNTASTTTPVLAEAVNNANESANDAKTAAQAVQNWISTTYTSDKNDLQTQIDSKIDTWYQSSDPSSGWSSAEKTKHTGDLWYKTSDSTTWRYNGSAWQEQDVPDAVFDSIDGKSTIFYGTTSDSFTGVQTGDYLVDSTDGCTYRYNGSGWTKVTDYNTAISSAVTTYDASQNQQAIFNKLTNNGQTQGIYLSEGLLYINATYIQSGSLSANYISGGTIDATDVTLINLNGSNITSGTIQDSSGNTSWNLSTGALSSKKLSITSTNFTLTEAGVITATSGTIGGFTLDATSIHTKDVAITSNANNSLGLSSSTFTRTIGGTSRSNLKLAIGSGFGVTNAGKLYASGVEISGAITATSGSFTGTVNASSGTIGDWIIGTGLQNTASGATVYFTPQMLKLGAFEADSTGAIGGANWYIDASGNASFANAVNFGTSSNPSAGISYTGGSVTNSATYDFLKVTEALMLGASGAGASLNVYGTTTFNSNVQFNSPATTYVDHEGTNLTSYIDSRITGGAFVDDDTIKINSNNQMYSTCITNATLTSRLGAYVTKNSLSYLELPSSSYNIVRTAEDSSGRRGYITLHSTSVVFECSEASDGVDLYWSSADSCYQIKPMATSLNVDIGNSTFRFRDIYLKGDLYLGGHTTAVGTVQDGTVSTTTLTTIGTVYRQASIVLSAGSWIIMGSVAFSNMSTTTYRAIGINTSNSLANAMRVSAISGAITNLRTMACVTITSSTTYYLLSMSGTASTTVSAATFNAIRIA